MTTHACPVCGHHFLKPFLAVHFEKAHPTFDISLLHDTAPAELERFDTTGLSGSSIAAPPRSTTVTG